MLSHVHLCERLMTATVGTVCWMLQKTLRVVCCAVRLQVDKEVHKCLELMREMEGDIARKRDASKRVKVGDNAPRCFRMQNI